MSDPDESSIAPVCSRWIGSLDGVGAPLPAAHRFVLAGIDWQAPTHVRIELRARRASGGWTPWVPASVLGHDSDRGETIAHALVGEPVWTGPADAVQLRSSAPVAGLNLHLVLAAAVAAPAWGADVRGGPTGGGPTGGGPTGGGPTGGGPTGNGPARGASPGGGLAGGLPAGIGRSDSVDVVAAQGFPLATPHLPAGPGQPPIIARDAWAARLPPRVAPAYGDVRLAFVHHSVNANGYSRAEVPAMLRSIYYFHTYTRGWNDFGYNFAVDAYGRIWEGRAGGIDRPVVGAQAGGYNIESFGAVLLGDFTATLPTTAAREALARLVAWKLALHGVPVTGRVTVEVDPPDSHYTRFRPGQHVSLPRVAGHRDGCTTDCPGNDMYVNGLPPLRRSVAQLVGRQLTLTLDVGPAPGAPYAFAPPYRIAPGTSVKGATYLDLKTVTLTAGRQLPLHGFLRSLAGIPVRKATVALQDLTATRYEEHEAKLASAVTRHNGLWRAVLKPHANLLLRALHAEAPAVTSALIVVGVKPELTLELRHTSGGVRASGTITPPKRHVVLEARSATGARRVVAHETVGAEGGRFGAVLRLAPGRYWVRAHSLADASNIEGESPIVPAYVVPVRVVPAQVVPAQV